MARKHPRSNFAVSLDEPELTAKKKMHESDRPHKSQTPSRHTGRSTRNSLDAAYHVIPSKLSTPKVTKYARRAHDASTRAATRKAKLAAELTNLADFNKPPVSRSRQQGSRKTLEDGFYSSDNDSEGRHVPQPSRRSVKVASLSDRLRTQGKRIIKRQAKAPSSRKRRDKLLAEVEQLQLWHGWESEEHDDSSDSDSEDEPLPRSHSRRYPPKVLGSQNTPWSELSGELRNIIYEYAMSNEEEKTVNVVHYPYGIPRRSVRGINSTTNFAHSYWGFTQTCRTIRQEFTPWLLGKRRVRTPIATLNDYIDTFHRPNSEGQRIGWIEPICRGAPLPEPGVEVVRDMCETYSTWSGSALPTTGLQGIRVTSRVSKEDGSESDDDEDDEAWREIILKLDVGRPEVRTLTHIQQLENLNRFIFASKLAENKRVSLQASFGGGLAEWVVRRPGTVYMRWKESKVRGKHISRWLDFARDQARGFSETIIY
ncbi:hypothetical protein N0V83_003204 [Neocucurbitaria cava]|uniref:Uncharacterized protein n=1 Tax=Neocucurbitaria cava TaxID=798079 RepID=A0A9W9CNF9_9PLEO|nr:hypothetical protein N0V83_003204 [Neocucurbitaria cava]